MRARATAPPGTARIYVEDWDPTYGSPYLATPDAEATQETELESAKLESVAENIDKVLLVRRTPGRLMSRPSSSVPLLSRRGVADADAPKDPRDASVSDIDQRYLLPRTPHRDEGGHAGAAAERLLRYSSPLAHNHAANRAR